MDPTNIGSHEREEGACLRQAQPFGTFNILGSIIVIPELQSSSFCPLCLLFSSLERHRNPDGRHLFSSGGIPEEEEEGKENEE